MSTSTKLFEPFKLGPITLPNRVVMAPLTRNRANPTSRVPSPLAAEYYGQRASAGLLITEASQVSQQGQGYQDTPGIYSNEQVAGWRKVTDEVHKRGGRIFIQLWHVGPHLPHLTAARPWRAGRAFGDPRQDQDLRRRHLRRRLRASRARACRNPRDHRELPAGRGERHRRRISTASRSMAPTATCSTSSPRTAANKRTDAYGGSIENRARLMLEVARAVVAEVGAERTGIRISPVTPANDVSDSNPQPLFDHIVDGLDALKLVYIHVVEGATGGPRDIAPFDYASLRKRFSGAYIANNGYDLDLANKVLSAGAADLIAFGRPFISNPDLVDRLRKSAPLNELDKATLYGGGAKGYTDYPTLKAAEAAE